MGLRFHRATARRDVEILFAARFRACLAERTPRKSLWKSMKAGLA